MTVHAVAADEQLTVHYGPDTWRLQGPDGVPVLEVRARTIFYHPLFGRWRDLPPGDRLSVDGIQSVQVRWDGGWAVGLELAPLGLWRRLVRWTDSRDLREADNAARALSALIGCPLRTGSNAPPPVYRVGYGRGQELAQSEDAGPAPSTTPVAPPAPPESEQTTPLSIPGPEQSSRAATLPPVYAVEDASEVRLPLRLGGGAVLRKDRPERLRLVIPTDARGPAVGITLLGLLAVTVFVLVIYAVRSNLLPFDPVVSLIAGGVVLLVVGVVGVLLLTRLEQRLQKEIIFDREGEVVQILPASADEREQKIPLAEIHGVRLRGAAIRRRGHLAYQRTVSLLVSTGDVAIFTEIRDTPLPADPAVMPSLPALRRQADEKAGPSLARAGARVLACFLRVPLADE
ncbi:MAG: hypothetical protein Kow0077_16740 [Anaerolineae bacterium]